MERDHWPTTTCITNNPAGVTRLRRLQNGQSAEGGGRSVGVLPLDMQASGLELELDVALLVGP